MAIGTSYQPGADVRFGPQVGPGGGPGQQNIAPQEAIRLLSLRTPQSRTAGAGGVAAKGLLNAPGGGGTDLDYLLRALMAAFGAQSRAGMVPPGMAGGPGAPRVSPVGGATSGTVAGGMTDIPIPPGQMPWGGVPPAGRDLPSPSNPTDLGPGPVGGWGGNPGRNITPLF